MSALVVKSSFSSEVALLDTNLPTEKVERMEKFGGLTYLNTDLYSFVENLEFVFKHTITSGLLVMNGLYLIQLVYKSLNTNDNWLKNGSKLLRRQHHVGYHYGHVEIFNTSLLLNARQRFYT